ncbi:MAG: molybdopterin-dependent oxidoreductase, partial [Acidobacteriota bacterium]
MPWQLADDSAIWSQNWSWRASPERGEITTKPGICTLCEGGCGIQARLVDKKRVISLDGNPDHPISRGGTCALCASGHQFLYATYRVTQPMKQTKQRGDASGFKPVSWDEALGEISKRLTNLKAEGKTQSVACVTGRRRSSMDELWLQFLSAYGSPNIFKMPSQSDSLRLAALMTVGQNVPFAFNVENASYILSFSANLIEGWGSMGRMQNAYRLWHQEVATPASAKIVQVEPRCSLSASKADAWIAIAPGTEPALALAIAHVMIKENLYDADFVANNVFGFEDWTDAQGKARKGFKSLVLESYSPEAVSKITGVDVAKIRDLAKDFSGQKSAVAVWGESNGDSPNMLYHDLAFVALNALKGNLSPAGMMSLVPSVPLAALPAIPTANIQTRLDLQATPIPLPGNGVNAFFRTMAKGGAYPIEVLMVHEANPAYSLAESKTVNEALAKVGMLVSFSSYMDETALQSDLILPNPTAFERYEDVIGLPNGHFGYYALGAPLLPA